MLEVQGKVALITGALGGIGQAYTKALLKNGLKGISLIDINEEIAESFQNELSKEFGPNKTIFIKTDLHDKKQIKDAFEMTIAHFKQLDIVINNAGVMEEDDPIKTVTVNLIAPLIITELAMKTYLPKYQKDGGIIINTCSITGLEYNKRYPVYSVSKTGVLSMSSAFGNEENYEKFKVKVLTICPGGTLTPLIRKCYKNEPPLGVFQCPFLVGECLLKALESCKNGSVWVVDKNIKEFDYSQIQSIGKKFMNEL